MAAPLVWVATELGRTHIFGGFPWVLLGYSQATVLPIAQLASLRPNGPTWATADLIVNPRAGTCQAADGRGFWGGPWQWSGTAGRPVVPERLEHAAKEQLRHLWDTQRGAQPPAPLQGEEAFTTAAGWTFSVPRRVLEMLEADIIPVVAA